MDVVLVPVIVATIGFLNLYTWILFVRIIITLLLQLGVIKGLGPTMSNVYMALYMITEPVLEYTRRLIPPLGMLDLSPLVVFVAIQIFIGILTRLAVKLQAVPMGFY